MAQTTTAPTPRRVDTKHAGYKVREAQWSKCRDCYDGSDAVKAEKVAKKYLPPLDTHNSVDGAARYEAYKTRALFYNALSRTVDGLAGAVFQKPPKVTVPKEFEPSLKDITLRGEPADLVALVATREVLTTGRYGILVDITSGTKPKAYWTGYRAEDIYNWREERINGEWILTMVVLREDHWVPDKNDPEFVVEKQNAYRVLRLENGVYTSERWEARGGVGAPGLEVYEPVKKIQPTRRGQPLDYIPFTFFGPTSIACDVAKPPVLDLAEVNLSHYRTSADLEHGRHYVALPTPWIAGGATDPNGDIVLGPAGVIMLDQGGAAGMLEFSGSGLGSLETADGEKRKMMATLGARLLEDSGGPAETATAVEMRHSGEHATLRTITGAVEQGVSQVLQMSVWWTQGTGEYDKASAGFELNKDYFNIKMNAEQAKTLLLMLQAEAISYETFWDALARGNFVVTGRDSKEEKAQIERERPDEPGPNPVGPSGVVTRNAVAPPPGMGLPPAPGVKPGAAGASPANGAKVSPAGAPPGTHLVRDAGQPGVPKSGSR